MATDGLLPNAVFTHIPLKTRGLRAWQHQNSLLFAGAPTSSARNRRHLGPTAAM
jgi:hypothetical protein